MSFEQAAIKIEKVQEFARLQAAVEQAFLPEKVERFLKQLDSKGIRIRDFDGDAGGATAGRRRGRIGTGAPSSCIRRCRFPIRRRCASFICRGSKASTSTLRHKFKKLYQYY